MSSPAQISANQANSQLSTGPVTPDGKASVARNAIRHGLTARHLVIRSDEQEEFTALQGSLLAELDPQGAVEAVTFHELVHSAWSLHRFRRIEAQCSSGSPNDFLDPQTTTVLDRLSRYQARSQRAYYKSLQQLHMLQTSRDLRAPKPGHHPAAEVPSSANIHELTKQSHSGVTEAGIELAIHLVEQGTGMPGLNETEYSVGQTISSSATEVKTGFVHHQAVA